MVGADEIRTRLGVVVSSNSRSSIMLLLLLDDEKMSWIELCESFKANLSVAIRYDDPRALSPHDARMLT